MGSRETGILSDRMGNDDERLSNKVSANEAQRTLVSADTAGFGRSLLTELDIELNDKYHSWGDLGLQQAQNFFDQYLCMAQTLPFAIEPILSALDTLVTTNPILLLTMLLTGSSSDPIVEKQGENLFRHILADRVIVKGQKSAELFQSLLIYLSWYHHRFDTEGIQFYQLLQLANGMIYDLGLPKRYSRIRSDRDQSVASLNEMRAFLLCFYINCGGAVLGYDRPENMQCFGSLRNAAHMLASISPRDLDKQAPALAELLHVVAENFGHPPDSDRATHVLRTRKVLEWEATYLKLDTPATLRSSFHFITAYSILKSSGISGPSSEDIAICVLHFEAMLSSILDRGMVFICQMGIIEWAHLITTLFLLARLGGFEMFGSTKDGSACHRPLVHQYVGRLRSLMYETRTSVEQKIASDTPHLFSWLERILEAVTERAKSWQAGKNRTGHQGSAYELVNSFLHEGKDRPGQVRSQERSKDVQAIVHFNNNDDFWSEFMSDWLDW